MRSVEMGHGALPKMDWGRTGKEQLTKEKETLRKELETLHEERK